MNFTSKNILLGAFWMALFMVTGYAHWSMRSGAAQLDAAVAKELECRALAVDIDQLRRRPGFAALAVDSPRTITTRAEQASQQAGIDPSALIRIEPQSALRLSDSPYRIRPTRLELRRVTLEQAIKFTHAMIDETQGTTVRDLRLTASNTEAGSDPDPDQWNVELVLTQLIFAPTSR